MANQRLDVGHLERRKFLGPWRKDELDEELGSEENVTVLTGHNNNRETRFSNESLAYSLNEGANVSLEFTDKDDPTLQINMELKLAVETEDEEAVNLCLSKGADPNFSFGPGKLKCIHLAAQLGQPKMVELLVNSGAQVDITDAKGLTALHIAAGLGMTNIIDVLVQLRANVNVKDFVRANESGCETPLHRAARKVQAESVRKLISLGAKVDVVEAQGKTPLMLAAHTGAFDCIQVLIENKADPNITDNTGVSALTLLGSGFVTRKNEKNTNYCESLEALIKNGAEVNVKDSVTGATPLHHAAILGQAKATELLLSAGANLHAKDNEGNTVMHVCCMKGKPEILKILLFQPDADSGINKRDNKDRTPLHKAAYRGSTECIQLLLKSGADLGLKTKSGVSAMTLILQLPKGPKILHDQFDESITTNGVDPTEYSYQLNFNYSVLMSKHKSQQMNVVEDILDHRHEQRTADLFQHPLVASFLFLKWRKIRLLFFSTVIAYVILAVGITADVWTALSYDKRLAEFQQSGNTTQKQINLTALSSSPTEPPTSSNNTNTDDNFLPVLRFQLSLIFIVIIIVFQEVIQLASMPAQYFQEAESYIKWGTLITASAIIFEPIPWDEWVHFVAAWAVLLAWAEVTFLLGRLPTFGVYALMFYSVALNLVKFIFVFCFFLAGFSFSFQIVFIRHKEAFANPWSAILRTLAMMTGDLSYDDYMSEGNHSIPVTAHLIYLLFLILVVLVLMNLLIGLAVNDIQGLQKEGNVKRLRKQAQFIVYLEDVVNSNAIRFFKCNGFVSKLNSWINQKPTFTTHPSARKQQVQLPADIVDDAVSIVQDGKKLAIKTTLNDTYSLVQECAASIKSLDKRMENLEQDFIGLRQFIYKSNVSELNVAENEYKSSCDATFTGSAEKTVETSDAGRYDSTELRPTSLAAQNLVTRRTNILAWHSSLQEIKTLLVEIKTLKSEK